MAGIVRGRDSKANRRLVRTNGVCAPARQDMFRQKAMKPGKVLIMAFWLLIYSDAFFWVSWFPAQTLVSVVKLHPIKNPCRTAGQLRLEQMRRLGAPSVGT